MKAQNFGYWLDFQAEFVKYISSELYNISQSLNWSKAKANS
jgi:hypothetical protein